MITAALIAAMMGFSAAFIVARFRLSAFRFFVAGYAGSLVLAFCVFLAQGPFILALLGASALALYSLVPAAACFLFGLLLVRLFEVKTEEVENAP